MLWNLAFVVISVATLFWIAREETNLLLRVWICGYVMQLSANSTAMIPGFTSSGSSSESNGDRVTRPVRWHMLYIVLTLAYLAMDVFFLVLCSLLDCLLSTAYCFCVPCVIAFMYEGVWSQKSRANLRSGYARDHTP
ncbi:hypothetical protein Hanom_Chr02g00164641 [Helianthus anomalus]